MLASSIEVFEAVEVRHAQPLRSPRHAVPACTRAGAEVRASGDEVRASGDEVRDS
jgi:hypothetical protein